jgi:hypothetical protein
VKAAAIIGGAIVIAAACAVGGFALGRHTKGDGSERQRAVAYAQEIIGAANDQRDGVQGHLVWIGKAAPGIWRFRVKANGENRYGCHQIILKQFWHGQGTAFHGTGHVDSRLCTPRARG